MTEHPVSLTEIFDQAKRIKRNLMVSDQRDRTLHLPQKLKAIVRHGLKTDVFVQQILRASEH